jgi:hypothetical protein
MEIKLQQDFEEYIRKVYPEGPINQDQRKQLHRAFLAGALCTFHTIYKFAELEDKEAENAVGELGKYIMEQCIAQVKNDRRISAHRN